MAALDDRTQGAVDSFFAGWKRKVEARLEAKALTHRDAWVAMSPEQIMEAMIEEITDALAYAVFFRYGTEDNGP